MRLRKKNGNGGCGFCLHFAIQTGNVDSLPETPTLAQCFQYFYFDSHFHIVTESGRWSKKSKTFFYLPDVSGFHLQTSSP